jgi:hypothetical protein
MSSEKDFIIFSPVSLTAMAPIIDENSWSASSSGFASVQNTTPDFFLICKFFLHRFFKTRFIQTQ